MLSQPHEIGVQVTMESPSASGASNMAKALAK
jgi:hypothetical protein